MSEAVGFGSWDDSYIKNNNNNNNNVLRVHFILNQVLTKKHASNYLQNLQPKWTKVSFCNLITRGEKEEGKKRGEAERERRDALLITEPSAESWTAANSTGSWDGGMGGGRERERKGREAAGRRGSGLEEWVGVGCGVGDRGEEEMGSPEHRSGREGKKKKTRWSRNHQTLG